MQIFIYKLAEVLLKEMLGPKVGKAFTKHAILSLRTIQDGLHEANQNPFSGKETITTRDILGDRVFKFSKIENEDVAELLQSSDKIYLVQEYLRGVPKLLLTTGDLANAEQTVIKSLGGLPLPKVVNDNTTMWGSKEGFAIVLLEFNITK